jgi:predicted HTH transcriptional regulator
MQYWRMNLPSHKTKEQISKEIADANTGVARRASNTGHMYSEMQLRVWDRLAPKKRGRLAKDNQYLTAREIAEIWNLTESQVRNAIANYRSGRLKFCPLTK